MWIMTQAGFFSVVAHRQQPDVVLIRGRVKGDLVELAEECGQGIRVEHTPDADYPYRIYMKRALFAQYMMIAIDDIKYPNFKSRVEETLGKLRARVYHSIWATLHDLEEAGSRKRTG